MFDNSRTHIRPFDDIAIDATIVIVVVSVVWQKKTKKETTKKVVVVVHVAIVTIRVATM